MTPEIILTIDNVPVDKIKFASVPIGETRELFLTVENTGDIEIDDLIFNIDHPDIKITSFPTKLNAHQKSSLNIQYKPETQIDKGLNVSLMINGKYTV